MDYQGIMVENDKMTMGRDYFVNWRLGAVFPAIDKGFVCFCFGVQ